MSFDGGASTRKGTEGGSVILVVKLLLTHIENKWFITHGAGSVSTVPDGNRIE